MHDHGLVVENGDNRALLGKPLPQWELLLAAKCCEVPQFLPQTQIGLSPTVTSVKTPKVMPGHPGVLQPGEGSGAELPWSDHHEGSFALALDGLGAFGVSAGLAAGA